MKSTAPKRLGSITVLSLLALLAIAIGAQAVLASSSGTTPAAGTEGRGGAPPVSDAATLVLENTVTNGGYLLLSKEGVPQPVTDAESTSFSAWVSVGIAIGVVLVVLAAWAASRRRSPAGEESTAAFCVQHPQDTLCAMA